MPGLNTVGKKFLLSVRDTNIYPISASSQIKFIPVQTANFLFFFHMKRSQFKDKVISCTCTSLFSLLHSEKSVI